MTPKIRIPLRVLPSYMEVGLSVEPVHDNGSTIQYSGAGTEPVPRCSLMIGARKCTSPAAMRESSYMIRKYPSCSDSGSPPRYRH